MKKKLINGFILCCLSFSLFAASGKSGNGGSGGNSGSSGSGNGPKQETIRVDPKDNRTKPSQTSGERDKDPRSYKEIPMDEASITIMTDVSGVDVYLNGVYQGKTPLIIADLLPGYYTVELRKSGYETERFVIRVRRGYNLEYYATMNLIYGTISLKDVPAGSSVSVSGSFSTTWSSYHGEYRDCQIKIAPGRHDVQVRKFGYETYSRNVQVEAYQTTSIFVELDEAEFELSDYTVDKDSFNPKYNGRLGRCEVSFYVTAPEVGEINIYDENNQVVWNAQLEEFTTWNQSFTWDGCDKRGAALPDGYYSIVISAGGWNDSVDVYLDASIAYPVMRATKVGGGVGSLPLAFSENTSYVMLSLEGGADWADVRLKSGAKVSEGGSNFGAGILFNFRNHYELNFNFNGYYGDLFNNESQICTSFKLYNSQAFSSGTLCYGALIRYGWCSEIINLPYGIDNGNGLGAGLTLGYDFGKAYLGYTTQFITGAVDGDLSINNNIWNNGVCFSIQPADSLKISLWGALNSDFGIYNPEEKDSVDSKINMTKGINGGLEVDFMPGNLGLVLGGKFDVIFIPGYGEYYSTGFGLSYLF